LKSCENIFQHQNNLNDFSDTAGLINQMDLIISVDTSVAHLSGAIGKKVWLLLPFMPDFRWMLDRDDSPWYPNLKLFRQPTISDWESVIKLLMIDLKNY
jgi:ADP-heptose:LPS heptosyltransferase